LVKTVLYYIMLYMRRLIRRLNMSRATKITVLQIAGTLILAVVIFTTMQATFESRVVEGACMEPNLYDGQRVLVIKAAYWSGEPQRGDVVIFEAVDGTDRTLIKRIIGLPGENISMSGGKVYIDGEPLEEPYIKGVIQAFPLTEIPADNYFVMGDNRDHSTDSRRWGTLPRENIIGRAWLCYWPMGDWHLIRGYAYTEDR